MLYIVLLTLLCYSLIATAAYFISGEKEEVLALFGFGIVGWCLLLVHKTVKVIGDTFKHNIGKRSIFIEESTGNKYKCKTKEANNVVWVEGYKLLKRYAAKSEWSDIPDFSKEFIESSKRNCNNCKHDKECRCEYPYTKIKCKHDEYGTVLEFDKFEE